jgi:two-component system CheB/CheR fusion protein
MRDKLESLLCSGKKVEEYVMEHDFPGIGRKKVILNAHRLEQGGTDARMIVLALEEVGEGGS